jgi:hypothetical protein
MRPRAPVCGEEAQMGRIYPKVGLPDGRAAHDQLRAGGAWLLNGVAGLPAGC